MSETPVISFTLAAALFLAMFGADYGVPLFERGAVMYKGSANQIQLLKRDLELVQKHQ